nr:hypothetical protein JVH1_8358 [Rhodococcus sp. JVH1]
MLAGPPRTGDRRFRIMPQSSHRSLTGLDEGLDLDFHRNPAGTRYWSTPAAGGKSTGDGTCADLAASQSVVPAI